VFINVLGNAVATIVVGKWGKDFDHEQARAVIAGKPVPEKNSPVEAREASTV
jgi:aerobic C4-dicarboxylate transport protein